MSDAPSRPLLHYPDVLALQTGSASLRQAARDTSLGLMERLEALEDVAESEVGDTPLMRSRALERRFGLRHLYLKIEGDNPTGTQKDRIAFAQVFDALRRGYDTVCFATCGNYGVAMAHAADVAGLRCVAVVPESYHAPRIRQIAELGATVLRAGADYEEAVVAASALAATHEHYDANPGGENELLQVRAYKDIASEIYDELRDAPAAVAVPASNGTTLVGVHRGFVSLERRGRSSRVPAVVCGSASRKNPIVRAFRKGLDRCEDLAQAAIRETTVNEPLINWHAIDGQAALDAIRGSQGFAADISDKRMKELARILRDEQGLSVQPAATAGLAALLALHEQSPLKPDRYVAVLTGRAS